MQEMAQKYNGQLNFMYFDAIRKIPRMSFHEEKVADYIEHFAIDNGLWYHRDKIGNIIIKKPGTKDKDGSDPIILQAHTDMVCEKEQGCEHDFYKDPIDVYIEDGWMKARETTLGADDGAGVANILGILSEENLSHPPLECVFTVQEENGMGGAKKLDYSMLKSKRMIGLDGIREGSTIFSASAVYGGKVKKNIVIDANAADSNVFQLCVRGLTSGHGGLQIGNEQANAIKVTARILYKLNEILEIKLCDIQGGGLVHVIPRDCTSIFEVDRSIDTEKIVNGIHELAEQIELEYLQTDPGMEISCRLIPYNGLHVDKKCSDELLQLLYLLPVGAAKRNSKFLDRVEGSWNLSIICLKDGRLVIDVICRANYPLTTAELRSIVCVYAQAFDAVYEETFSYPGYHVPEDSPLTRIYEKVYRKHTGKSLEKAYIHSALDAGTIYEGLNGIDLIVVMPTVLDVHTPKERMNVDSFARTYEYLKDILALA